MTTSMLAPSAGQRFIGLPSGATYKADNSGNVATVASQDVVAMLQAGCTLQTSSSIPSIPMSVSGSQALAFASSGDVEYNVSLTGNTTFTITPPTGNGTFRRLILRITPNGFQATLPPSSTSIINSGGSPPTPSTSAVTIYTYGYDGITIDGGI